MAAAVPQNQCQNYGPAPVVAVVTRCPKKRLKLLDPAKGLTCVDPASVVRQIPGSPDSLYSGLERFNAARIVIGNSVGDQRVTFPNSIPPENVCFCAWKWLDFFQTSFVGNFSQKEGRADPTPAVQARWKWR